MAELEGGRYGHPELIKGLDMVRSVGEKYYSESGKSSAEIAVLLHERSSFYFREADSFLSPLVNMFKVWELERMGAPFDDFLVSDLKDLNTERYKVFVIPNCVYLTDEEMKNIREKCCKDGKAVIWCYAAGVLSDRGISTERMQVLTGIKTGYTMEAGELTVELPNCDNRYLAGLTDGVSYGTNGSYLPIEDIKEQAAVNCYPEPVEGFRISPRFWAEDEEAEVLGTIKGLGKHGLVVKKLENWTSVFSSAPMVPKEILRNIAREVGCHIYTDFSGQTMSCHKFFGFYAHRSGKCTIQLPQKSRVTELFSGELLSEATDELMFELESNKTLLLYLQEPAQM